MTNFKKLGPNDKGIKKGPLEIIAAGSVNEVKETLDWASGNWRGIITNDGPCPVCGAEDPKDHDDDCGFAVE